MIKMQLKELLERENYTCTELSRLTGVPYSFLLRMKKGRIRYIKYEYLEALCKAFRCQPNDLIAYSRTDT